MKSPWHRHPIFLLAVFLSLIVFLDKALNISAWNAITAVSTFLLFLTALFYHVILEKLQRPELAPDFKIEDISYFHDIFFPLFVQEAKHGAKGKNSLIMISNRRRKRFFGLIESRMAEDVEVKVTYIYEGEEKHTYHPTNLNWSGGRENPFVSIPSDSHHFLDFIKFINHEDKLYFQHPISRKWRESDLKPSEVAGDIRANYGFPEQGIYFRPWFIGDWGGIKDLFSEDDTYRIHFVINAKNCGPFKYRATLKWSKADWDKPQLEIEKEESEPDKGVLQKCFGWLKEKWNRRAK